MNQKCQNRQQAFTLCDSLTLIEKGTFVSKVPFFIIKDSLFSAIYFKKSYRSNTSWALAPLSYTLSGEL